MTVEAIRKESAVDISHTKITKLKLCNISCGNKTKPETHGRIYGNGIQNQSDFGGTPGWAFDPETRNYVEIEI